MIYLNYTEWGLKDVVVTVSWGKRPPTRGLQCSLQIDIIWGDSEVYVPGEVFPVDVVITLVQFLERPLLSAPMTPMLS